jgi:hypothetical protein
MKIRRWISESHYGVFPLTGLEFHVEFRVGEPERRLHLLRRRCSGEEKSQVAIALGEGHDLLAHRDRNLEPVDARNFEGCLGPAHLAQKAAVGNRQHHYTAGSMRSGVLIDRPPQGMT